MLLSLLSLLLPSLLLLSLLSMLLPSLLLLSLLLPSLLLLSLLSLLLPSLLLLLLLLSLLLVLLPLHSSPPGPFLLEPTVRLLCYASWGRGQHGRRAAGGGLGQTGQFRSARGFVGGAVCGRDRGSEWASSPRSLVMCLARRNSKHGREGASRLLSLLLCLLACLASPGRAGQVQRLAVLARRLHDARRLAALAAAKRAPVLHVRQLHVP